MKITSTQQNYTNYQNLKDSKTKSTPILNPIKQETAESKIFAYQDFNITFGARLFRTPANFFEQDFNRNNMPETMKNYLFDDYQDRQNIPPNQMLKIVFDDLNEAKSLEQVKRIYSEESLFANLKDVPNRKIRSGVIAEIDLMKEEGIQLFKDDKEKNLGMYLLKKIYLEGKTLKEINKDFQKDITDEYKGLSPIDYTTLSAYGIKYPKTSFWKSFIATREDFPYEYKPRKAVESRIHKTEPKEETTLSDIKKAAAKQKIEKNKFDNVKDWEIDKLADVVIKANGSLDETKKQMKKRNIKENESSNFVSKYMSEINSVVLEKVHASEEMKDLFEQYDKLNASQKNKFEAYWNSDPQIKELRSLAMKDTIKLFMEAYGVDGNNEEFQDLLEYAHKIKPKRKEDEEKHNKIQAEYDEMFANLSTDEEVENTGIIADIENSELKVQTLSQEELDKKLEEEAVKNGAKVFSFTSPDGDEIHIVANIEEEFNKILADELKLTPSRFLSRYMNFMAKSPLAKNDYKEFIVMAARLPEYAESQFMPKTNPNDTSANVNHEFQKKYPHILLANDQAVAERIINRLSDKDKYAQALKFDTQKLLLFAEKALNIDNWTTEERAQMDRDYDEYTKPVTNKNDINKINQELVSYLEHLNPDKPLDDDEDLQDELIKLMAANLKVSSSVRNMLSKVIRQSKFIEEYGGTSKILLKTDTSKSIKDVKCKLMLDDLLTRNINDLIPLLALSTDNIKTYVTDDTIKPLLIEKSIRIHNHFNK